MIDRLMERFNRVSVVGVDTGSAMIKAAEVVRPNGRPLLRRAAVKEAGKEDAVERMRSLIAEEGFSTSHAVLGLASPEVVVQAFDLGHLPKKELAGALRIEAEHAILNSHHSSAVEVDWHLFEPGSRDSNRGLLAVVPKQTLAEQVRAARAAGLVPKVVDVKGLALWNAYWTLTGKLAAQPKTTLLINLGAHTTNLTIAKGADELILVRDIQIGAMSPGGVGGGEWISELRDSLAYARSKGLRALEEAYVTGGGSSAEILPALRAALAVPVEIWNPLDHIEREEGSRPIDPALGPMLAVAIGLALRKCP